MSTETRAAEAPKKGHPMELALLAAIVAFWILLQTWILPALGIRTCCSQGCDRNSCSVPEGDEAATPQPPTAK
jgi:hypothetical protein